MKTIIIVSEMFSKHELLKTLSSLCQNPLFFDPYEKKAVNFKGFCILYQYLGNVSPACYFAWLTQRANPLPSLYSNYISILPRKGNPRTLLQVKLSEEKSKEEIIRTFHGETLCEKLRVFFSQNLKEADNLVYELISEKLEEKAIRLVKKSEKKPLTKREMNALRNYIELYRHESKIYRLIYNFYYAYLNGYTHSSSKWREEIKRVVKDDIVHRKFE